MLVDEKAVGTDQNKKFVMVVNPQNIVEYREISLGARADGLRIVTAGLQADEKIVVNGLQRLSGSLLHLKWWRWVARLPTSRRWRTRPRQSNN